MVATDRSDTATRAVEWAAEVAERYTAELLVLQVVPPEHLVSGGAPTASIDGELAALAQRYAGPRGRARVEFDSEPAEAIVHVAAQERADLLVVGNVGMRNRKEFLLSSVPNRVSHNAPCSVVIVNTADDSAVIPIGSDPAREAKEPSDGQLLRRAAEISAVLAKHRLGNLFDRGGDGEAGSEARARRLREALEELGPTFGKLGQILSTRPDLLPPAALRELSSLQDRVTPLSESEVVAVMEQELAVPWEDVFARIEPQPMAAGTIAQVHRAVLVDGERVVVKVQRPDAEETILQDLGLLEQFAAKASARPTFSEVIDVGAVVEHLSSSLRKELDFRHEAANAQRMRDVLKPFAHLDVPLVHTELSTARLLVMQEIKGTPVLQAPEGEARRAAGRELLEAYYQQVLAEGFFHADPHPGNMMWWQDTVYLLDLGMVGEADPELRRSLLLLLLAFWQEDNAFLAELMLGLSPHALPPEFDNEAYRADLADLLARYRHLPLSQLRLGPLLQDLTEMSLRHGVRLPAALVLIGKAFGQMQLAAAELDPSLDPFSVAGTFYLRQLAERLRGASNPRQLFYEGQKLSVRMSRLFESVERAVGARPGPGVQIELPAAEELTDAVGRASKRIALGVTAATAIVSTAITASSPRSARWTTPTFGVAAGILSGALLADLIKRG